jgi:BatD DUF11 like domain
MTGNSVVKIVRMTLALWLFSLLFISCSRAPVPATSNKEQGYSQNYTAGPITLHQQVNRKEITVADQLELSLEASAPENIKLKFPAYSASLGDFTLKETRDLPAVMTGTGENLQIRHRITYILEPYLSGTYTIPAMTITYSENDTASVVSELETEKIEIQVKSLLDQDTGQAVIKDIKPPLLLPPNNLRLALLIGLILLLVTLAFCGFYFWNKRNRKKESLEIELGPEEIARQELDRLLAENLLRKGEIKLFHLRISDILRRYIENRFGLQAPERTTEEFLVELSRAETTTKVLLKSHKALLTDFLTQCDLVKFAQHEPSITECEKTILICQEFIEKKKE